MRSNEVGRQRVPLVLLRYIVAMDRYFTSQWTPDDPSVDTRLKFNRMKSWDDTRSASV